MLINSENGKVLKAQVFETSKSSNEFEDFIEDIVKNIPRNYVVVAASKDDIATNLS